MIDKTMFTTRSNLKTHEQKHFFAILLIANQETVVEILSFLKQIAPKSTKHTPQSLADRKDLSKSTTELFYTQEKVDISPCLSYRLSFSLVCLLFLYVYAIYKLILFKNIPFLAHVTGVLAFLHTVSRSDWEIMKMTQKGRYKYNCISTAEPFYNTVCYSMDLGITRIIAGLKMVNNCYISIHFTLIITQVG